MLAEAKWLLARLQANMVRSQVAEFAAARRANARSWGGRRRASIVPNVWRLASVTAGRAEAAFRVLETGRGCGTARRRRAVCGRTHRRGPRGTVA